MSDFDDLAQFATVDGANDPAFFIRMLDLASQLPSVKAARPIILDGLQLRAGDAVLDVGCGLGYDAIEIARRVGPNGRVVGVDLSELMLEEARRRTDGLGIPVSFELADVMKLPFDDGSFDVCRTERVLIYVPDVDQAFSEMCRVTRPGGRIGVLDVDADSTVIDHPDRETTRSFVHTFCDGFPNGSIGTQLPRLFKRHGLTDLTVTGHHLFFDLQLLELMFSSQLAAAQKRGDLTEDDVDTWWEPLRNAQENDTLFASLSCFIVSGAKPE